MEAILGFYAFIALLLALSSPHDSLMDILAEALFWPVIVAVKAWKFIKKS